MKHIIALALSTFALTSFALDKLPNGTWTGTGQYFGEKAEEKGTYEEKLTIKDNVLTSELKSGEHKMVYVTKAEFKTNGFVNYTVEDKQKGSTMKASGYCGALACHLQTEDGSFEMTIGFKHDHVYEFGSGVENKTLHRFEGALKKVAN